DVEIVRVKDHVGFYVFGKDGTRTCLWKEVEAYGEKMVVGFGGVGDDGKLVGVFWADEQDIRNYATFGLVLHYVIRHILKDGFAILCGLTRFRMKFLKENGVV
ncbi:hypothetical protein Tco_1424611, partial [Tanacetum coccineum]